MIALFARLPQARLDAVMAEIAMPTDIQPSLAVPYAQRWPRVLEWADLAAADRMARLHAALVTLS